MEAWPSEIWICSSGARPWWASLAKVRGRSCGVTLPAGETGAVVDGLEDGLSRDRPVADEAGFRDGPQHKAGVDAGGGGPAVQHRKGPGRHRDDADAAVLADEVDDRPAALGVANPDTDEIALDLAKDRPLAPMPFRFGTERHALSRRPCFSRDFTPYDEDRFSARTAMIRRLVR